MSFFVNYRDEVFFFISNDAFYELKLPYFYIFFKGLNYELFPLCLSNDQILTYSFITYTSSKLFDINFDFSDF